MTTVVSRSSANEESSDKHHPQSIVVTKLLSRPQTAVPSISSPPSTNQKTLSSITVIGHDSDGAEAKRRIKSAVHGHHNNKFYKQQQGIESLRYTTGLPQRIYPSISSINISDSNNDIPRIKEAILQKSFSNPNFSSNCPDSSLSLVDSKKDSLSHSRSIVRRALRDSKRSFLTVKSASVVLLTRPSSSISLSNKLHSTRPKTAGTVLSQDLQLKKLEIDQEIDDEGATQQDKAVSKQRQDPTVSETDKSATVCHSAREGKSVKTFTENNSTVDVGGPNSGAESPNSKTDGRSKRKKGIVNDEKDQTPRTENVHNYSQVICSSEAGKSGLEVQESSDQTLKQDVKVEKDTLRPRCSEPNDDKSDSSSKHHSSPRHVTPSERDLSPVRCTSSQSTHVCLPNLKTFDTSNVLTSSSGINSIGELPTGERLDLSSLDTINDNSETTRNTVTTSPSSKSLSSPRVYKMAKVELYEKSSIKYTRSSILDEIKKQNMLLEERNSDLRSNENRLNRPRSGLLTETGRENKCESAGFAEKGSICGSPAFKFLSEQLRNMKGNIRPGSHVTTKKPTAPSTRDSQAEGTSKKPDQENKLQCIRPLSDYIINSSPENLRVTGGACTYKNGEHAVSNAAENIASQAGIISKVSLQGTPAKCDNGGTSSDANNLQSKVHVSLSYLKEKNRINSNSVAFRYRLDACLDQNSDDRDSSNDLSGLQIRPSYIAKQSGQGKDKPTTVTNSNDTGTTKDKDESKAASHDLKEGCNYSGTDNTDSEQPDNDPDSAQTSASSTPTAAFSGSELLYPNDGVHRSHGEELSASDMPGYERERQKLRDLEIGNRRPASRSKRTSYSVVDKVSFDRERDDLRALNNSLPAKTPILRNPIQRNSLVRGEAMISNRSVGPNSSRDSEDLIAMGTIWSPANNNNSSNGCGAVGSMAPTRSSSTTTGSNKSIPLNNSNGISQRKPVTVSLSTSARLGHCNGASSGGGAKNVNRENAKEVEAKYSDPLIGAPASYQQRLMDLASLEAETIRWERTKRVKKKPKDRDS